MQQAELGRLMFSAVAGRVVAVELELDGIHAE
jgi:hypothetical protein